MGTVGPRGPGAWGVRCRGAALGGRPCRPQCSGVEGRLAGNPSYRAQWAAEHLAAVVEGLAVAVCSRDRERRILYLNPRAEELTGFPSEAVRGEPCYRVLRHREKQGEALCATACPAAGCLAGKTLPPLALQVETAGGTPLAITARLSPLRDGAGAVVGFVEVFYEAVGGEDVSVPPPQARRVVHTPGTEGRRPPLILLVDDDEDAQTVIASSLRASRYRVLIAGEAPQALALAARERPDLVLLDLGLPRRSALEFIDRLRAWSAVPIIALSARGSEREKIAALDRGADDYVTKPLAMGELLARVRAALRRVPPRTATAVEVVRAGDLCVDLVRRSVTLAGKPIRLTFTEYELLACLVREADKAVSHAELLRQVWGPECEGQNEYLHTFIAQLRRKIEVDPSQPRRIITEPRYGYRFSLWP